MRARVFHTYSAERDKLVLPGVDVLVIGPVPPHVRRTVDQPGGIQHQGVPQQSGDEVRHPQRLPPQITRHEHGDEEAHEQHGRLVIPVEETGRGGGQKGWMLFTQRNIDFKHTNALLVRRGVVHSLT